MEETTRMAVFTRALKNGKTPKEAAKLARNSTVDFGRSGAWTEVANKVIPFLNARVQGLSNIISTAAKDPTRFVRRTMYTAAWPTMLLTANNLRYDTYQKIPDNEKRKYWIFMVGQTKGKDYQGKEISIPLYFKVPKGEAQQAVSNAVERVLTVGKQKYPDSTDEFIGKLFKDVSPVTESSVLPPVFREALELKTNYSIFRDSQIEPDYTKVEGKWYKTEDVEPKFREKWNTSEAAKALGSVLGWSPIKIDYVIQQGLMTDLVRIGDLVTESWLDTKNKGTFEKLSQFPVVRQFMGVSDYGEDLRKKAADKKKVLEKTTRTIESRKQLRQPKQ
jgi:hypothetical protein